MIRLVPSLIRGKGVRAVHTSVAPDSLLEQVKTQASFFGVDPTVAYDPALPVELFQNAALTVRETFDVGWPVALLTLAASFRIATFPLYVGSILKGKRRAEAAKELTELRDMAKEAVLLRDQTLVQNIDREYKLRMKAYGLSGNPFQGFGYILTAQLPWVTTMLFAVRGMATQTDLFKSFATQSEFLWCPSLALPDPYGLLPLISTAAIVLSSPKSPTGSNGQGNARGSISARDQLYVQYAIRGACFTFLPFTMQLPVGILLFFIFNTAVNRLSVPLIMRFMWKPRDVGVKDAL